MDIKKTALMGMGFWNERSADDGRRGVSSTKLGIKRNTDPRRGSRRVFATERIMREEKASFPWSSTAFSMVWRSR